jgi:hypothetical protein
MALRFSNAVRTSRATVIRDAIDAGAGPGVIEIRTGAQPATPDTAATGTLLATIPFDDPSGTISTGVLTFTGLPNSDLAADATGTAGWARVKDSNGNAVLDVAVSVTGGGGELQFADPAFTTGEEIQLTAVSTITEAV